MRSRTLLALLLCLPLLGCATFKEKSIIEAYGRTMESYETAMRVSDFLTACQNVDPAALSRQECTQRFDKVKITSYEVLAVTVAKDNRKVDLTVEVQYFFLDRYVLKKIQFDQSWRYHENQKRWLLTDGPPAFQ